MLMAYEPRRGNGRPREGVERERLADLKLERVGEFLSPRFQPGAPQLSLHGPAQAPFGGPLRGSANENGRQALTGKAVKSEELRPFYFGGCGFGRVTSQPPVIGGGRGLARARRNRLVGVFGGREHVSH